VTRVPRNALEDGFHHSYARGVPNQAIYLDRLDYEAFMRMLRRTERRFGWRIYVACLMPNHYHLVTEGTVDTLSRGMHWLNGLYAQRFNRRHSRYGHLFASRFGARLVEEERYFETVCRYALENPVRAGLCETVEDWPWSICRL
jgi:putative transposase